MTLINPAALSLPFPAFGSFRSFDNVAESYSEFAELTCHLTSSFKVAAGALLADPQDRGPARRADQLHARHHFRDEAVAAGGGDQSSVERPVHKRVRRPGAQLH
jgi:hypothetical protein